jgi:two-component system nitrate/nitrite response regulator NarL
MVIVAYTDEPLLASALVSLVNSTDDIRIAQVCTSAQALPRIVRAEGADIVLVSMGPDVNATLIYALQSEAPRTRIILWVHGISTELAHHFIENGARGILRKTYPPEMLLKCLRKVHEGELWFEKTLTSSFLNGRAIKLTRREGQMIALLSRGLKNKEISSVLHICEGSVKVYLSRLYEKLGVLRNVQTSPADVEAEFAPGRPETLLQSIFLEGPPAIDEPDSKSLRALSTLTESRRRGRV